MLGRRVIVASVSMVITAVVYLFLRGSSAASMRRSMATAAALALPAAIAYSSLNFFVFEDISLKHYHGPPPAHVQAPAPRTSNLAVPPAPPAPPAAPAPPESLNVGHTAWEHEPTPVEQIAETSASGYFFFVAWAALFLSLRYAGEVRVLERRSAELRAAAQNAELRALSYQVNPHFLFNTLTSLSSLILTGASASRPEADDPQPRDLLPHQPERGDPTEDVSLAEEIALQRLYLDIETVRFSDRLHVQIDPARGAGDGAVVPGLILQPLVENAVKHGVSRTVRPVTIAIRARERADQLVLTVENSAALGPCEEGPIDGIGVGLRNVRDRLTARFGEEGQCHWRAPAAGSFEVELTMPIIRNGR